MRALARLCEVPWQLVGIAEDAFVLNLGLHVKASKENQNSGASRWRIPLIIAAGVVGAGLLVITGGLAAPVIAAGIGGLAVVGGSAGTAAAAVGTWMATTAGYAVLVSLIGASGLGLGAYRMERRTAGLHVFEFDRLSAEPWALLAGVEGEKRRVMVLKKLKEDAIKAREQEEAKRAAKKKGGMFSKLWPFGGGGGAAASGAGGGSESHVPPPAEQFESAAALESV